MNREGQIDDDGAVSLRHAIEQCRQGLDTEIAGMKPAAASRQDVQSARMMADEGAQQLVVETLGCGDNLFKLKLGCDVEVVAHVARLEIKIDQSDFGVLARLVFHEMNGGFDGKG